MSHKEAEKTTPTKQFKSIAPTAVTTTSSNSAPSQKNVPPFLNKLYSMVSDPESDDLICWSDDGTSFFVNRQEDFARKVLPRFFKHKKFSSFVRQLNMYGFHKVPHLQQGVLETDSESERWEFSNPHFQRNQRDLLLLVNRKKGPNLDEKEISPVDLQHILEEIQSIKKHQMNISTQLQNIQRDNQVLWQETIAARERHSRHQETIDKILRFLASVFSSGDKRAVIPRKRRFLLGPADGSDHEAELDQDHLIDSNYKNTATSITEESGRPTKIPRQNESSAATSSSAFNIDDYAEGGKSDLLGLSTALPDHLKESAKTAGTSSDLEDAIALNDQSKNDHTALTSLNDFSNIANIPQLQNIQNLISMAQSNVDLMNQLTNEAYYGTTSSPSFSQAQQPYNSNNNYNNISNTTISPYNPSILTSAPNASVALPPLSSAINTNVTQQQPRSIEQVTNSISNITNTADALNQDIDDLDISLQALAQHLGFDPTKIAPPGEEKIDNDDEGELLDMDEFLNTYGNDVHSEMVDPNPSTVIITDIPSSATARSPSPVVTTPGSMATAAANLNKK